MIILVVYAGLVSKRAFILIVFSFVNGRFHFLNVENLAFMLLLLLFIGIGEILKPPFVTSRIYIFAKDLPVALLQFSLIFQTHISK